MSFSLSSITPKPYSNPFSSFTSKTPHPTIRIKCQTNPNGESSPIDAPRENVSKLDIGSPVIITEAPKMIKTAASVPCLRVNANLVKAGDVGRVVSRKPKDVWAVRLSIGTYLIDRKYFEPLELDE